MLGSQVLWGATSTNVVSAAVLLTINTHSFTRIDKHHSCCSLPFRAIFSHQDQFHVVHLELTITSFVLSVSSLLHFPWWFVFGHCLHWILINPIIILFKQLFMVVLSNSMDKRGLCPVYLHHSKVTKARRDSVFRWGSDWLLHCFTGTSTTAIQQDNMVGQ